MIQELIFPLGTRVELAPEYRLPLYALPMATMIAVGQDGDRTLLKLPTKGAVQIHSATTSVLREHFDGSIYMQYIKEWFDEQHEDFHLWCGETLHRRISWDPIPSDSREAVRAWALETLNILRRQGQIGRTLANEISTALTGLTRLLGTTETVRNYGALAFAPVQPLEEAIETLKDRMVSECRFMDEAQLFADDLEYLLTDVHERATNQFDSEWPEDRNTMDRVLEGLKEIGFGNQRPERAV